MFLKKISKLALFLALFGLIQSSYQQTWKNNKLVWEQAQQENLQQQQQQQYNSQYLPENGGLGSLIGSNVQSAPNDETNGKHLLVQNAPAFFHPRPVPVVVQAPPPVPAPLPLHKPVVLAPAPLPVAVPLPVPVPGAGPYPIQQQTLTVSGEAIVENLVGGIPFNCAGKPTGHYRDSNFCDVFHACVFGQRQKTYSCPFVGEHSYFDDVSRKCEFVKSNPLGCASNAFYH